MQTAKAESTYNITDSTNNSSKKVLTQAQSSKKNGQSNLLDLKTKEQEGARRIESPEEFMKPVDIAKQNLDLGWKSYKSKNFNDAVKHFKKALKHPHTSNDARLGLAYSYIKLSQDYKAVALLEKLIEDNVLIEELVSILLNILIDKKEYEKAESYISKLDRNERENWGKKLQQKKEAKVIAKKEKKNTKKIKKNQKPKVRPIVRDFKKAKLSSDKKKLLNFKNKYNNALNRCIEPGFFLETAKILRNQYTDESRNIYNNLLSSCLYKWDLRIASFYELKSISTYEEIKNLIDNEMVRSKLPSQYRKKVTEIKINILKERLAKLSFENPESSQIADDILAFEKNDPDALLAKGWWNYNSQKYEDAYKIFKDLYAKNPENNSYATGLIYTLIELNEEDKALKVLSKANLEAAEKKKVESLVYFRKGKRLYDNKNYAEAKPFFEKVIAIDPENDGAKTLYAWTLTNTGKSDKALSLFLEKFEKGMQPEIAEGVLINYEKLNQKKEAISFSKNIGKSDHEKLKAVAGNYLARNHLPITAARINPDSETFYFNADKPYIETVPYYRFKSGSSGTSELNEFSIPISLTYPVTSGGILKFSFISHYLNSGDAPSSPFVGTAPDGSPQIRDLETSLWVFTPEVSFEKEGNTDYNFDLGLTPFNGPLFPVPTFSAEVKNRYWRLNIHQRPVKESILSYVGLEDPFSSREFGRVLKLGVEGEFNYSTQSAYWITLIGGYDYYWGTNVESNNNFNASLSIGKTFDAYENNLSIGLFAAFQHFSDNLDFFTFGHGGYFSPEAFIITGPTARFSTKPYKTFWLDAQVSGGLLYFETEDAPFFPLADVSPGEFDGDNSFEFGFNIKLEALKLVTRHIEFGGFGSVNRSSDFTEAIGGIKLKLYTHPRNTIISTENSHL